MGRKADRRQARAKKVQDEATRSALQWTHRRLDVLELLAFLIAFLLALGGGALVAWVLAAVAGLPFRSTWALSSLFLFIVPGGGVYLRELRRGRKKGTPDVKSEPKDPNG